MRKFEMESVAFNPARYNNKISERYYSLNRGNLKGSVGCKGAKADKHKIEVASCWDGKILYKDLTLSELVALTGMQVNDARISLKKEVKVYKQWVISKTLDMSKEDLGKHLKVYGYDGERYYFGSLSMILLNSAGVVVTPQAITKIYAQKETVTHGVAIYVRADKR